MNINYRGDDGSIRTLGDNELQHWKYIKKIPAGSGFRYFYSWDEYRAYLADPTAELKKAGSQVSKQIQSTTRRGSQEVRSTGRSVQKYVSKGRKKVESAINSRDRAKTTISDVRQVNASRSASIKQRLNDFAKKASQKWNSGKEAIKDAIRRGKQWWYDYQHPFERWERERKEKEAKERERLRNAKEKYKYLKKITINGTTRYFYSQDEIKAYERRNEYMANEPDFMKDVKHSDSPYTSEEDAIQVNPNFDRYDFDEDYEYNCAECTAIYELRRRGYDVESNGESGLGANKLKYNTDARYDLLFEDSQIDRLKPTKTDAETVKALEEEFAKMPPGSRGDISCMWKGGGAHSMAWQIDGEGKVHIIDTQVSGQGTAVEYSLEDLAFNMDNESSYRRRQFEAHDRTFWNQFDKVSATRIVRTDNLELKPEIKNICQNTDDNNRAKPNTERSVRGFYEERYEMSEEELIKKYSNLI